MDNQNRKEYWKVPGFQGHAFDLEARSLIALDLVNHFGSIAAKINGEDSSGRSKLELQDPTELVQRCFAIADEFVNECERRNSIRSYTMDEVLDMEDEVNEKKLERDNKRFAERANRKLNQT